LDQVILPMIDSSRQLNGELVVLYEADPDIAELTKCLGPNA